MNPDRSIQQTLVRGRGLPTYERARWVHELNERLLGWVSGQHSLGSRVVEEVKAIEMDFMRQLDFSQVQQGLLMVWIAVAGPVIVAAIPIKALDPLRRFWWPLFRRGKLLQSPDTAGRGLLVGILYRFMTGRFLKLFVHLLLC